MVEFPDNTVYLSTSFSHSYMVMMEFFLGIVGARVCIKNKNKSCNLNPSNLLIASGINTGAKLLEVLYSGVLDKVGAVILPNILVEHLLPQQSTTVTTSHPHIWYQSME